MSEFKVNVIGDSGPFSRLGKSIGYQINYRDGNFLVDCGAPVFQLLGSEGLTELDGIVGTHAHEDHKRWFTDIALHQKFSTATTGRVKLYGTHEILQDYRRASGPALERTLTEDSREILHLSFEDYIEPIQVGPTPKYRCKRVDGADGSFKWRVVNQQGEVTSPRRAKVIQSEAGSYPRMIFNDPVDDIWVDPQAYYCYDDERFYQNTDNSDYHLKDDLRLQPLKAPAWHGPPTSSLLFSCPEGQLFFSSDTVYDPDLWHDLVQPTDPSESLSETELEDRHYIRGEARHYIEQTWSNRRLEKALDLYEKDYVYIHDVSGPNSKVHTRYENLEEFTGEILLTHSPDEFTSLHPLAHLGKSYLVQDSQLKEVSKTGDKFPLDADCYLKRYSEYLVGYQSDSGGYFLVKIDSGQYDVVESEELVDPEAEIIMQVELYKDIGGDYYPILSESNHEYLIRPDGQVERQQHHEDGTDGSIIEGKRGEL
ncbi:MAG: hypothetical protein ABEK50_17470 [bacterium]